MTLRRQLERYGKWLVAIGTLVALGLVSAGYILVQQRFPLPWHERYTVRAEFATSAGLNPPGLGQPVNVAGVRVGTIASTTLRDGRSLVALEIDPEKLERVYSNARAVLVPNTPLKDMQVELYPGRPPARAIDEEDVIPVAQTQVPVDSDELTAALDADTRSFFQLLAIGADRGTRGRGRDLRAALRSLGPTAEQMRTIGAAMAARRGELRRLVHNLAVLGRAVESRDRQLAGLVVNAEQTLGALAREEDALRASLDRLPATLAAVRGSFESTTRLSRQLGPTLDALGPTVRRLPATLEATRPLLDEAEPILRDDVRPLVREAQPLARDLGPITEDLSHVAPDLITSVRVLTYVVNELAYNPPGDNEGFLFWSAWFAHNAASVVSTQDAHGAVIHGLGMVDCTTAATLNPLLELLLGTLPTC